MLNILIEHLKKLEVDKAFKIKLHIMFVLKSAIQSALCFLTDTKYKATLEALVVDLQNEIMNLPVEACKLFFKALAWDYRVERVITNNVLYICLESDDFLALTVIHDYLQHVNLISELQQEKGLLLPWGAAVELLLALEDSNAKVPDFSRLVKLLQEFHKVMSTICGIDSWQFAPDGFEAVISKKKTAISEEVYAARQKNVLCLVDYIWQQCGLAEEALKIKMIDSTLVLGSKAISVTIACLSQPQLQRLFDKNFLKNCHTVALVISKLTKEKAYVIPNLIGLTTLLAEEEKKRQQEITAQNKEEEQAKQIAHKTKKQEGKKPKPSHPHKNAKKLNKQLESQKSKSLVVSHSKIQPKSKPQGPKLPPQPAERARDPNSIPARSSEMPLSTPAGADNAFWSTVAKKLTEATPVERVEKLPFTEDEMIVQLQLLMDKMVSLIQAYEQMHSQSKLSEQKASDFMAGWHYLHGQICGMLALLPPHHMALSEFFDVHNYKDARFHNLGKHRYFPEGFWSLAPPLMAVCFPNTAYFEAAIAMMENKCAPLQESKKGLREILSQWSHYVENAFEHNNIVSLVADKSAEDFGAWIGYKIQQYAYRCSQLLLALSGDSPPIEIDTALRFFVSRIGELVGHLPLSRRNAFHKECRRFRNEAAHIFETIVKDGDEPLNYEPTLAEPYLDLVKLTGLLLKGERLSFFNKPADINNNNNEPSTTWEFYVNPNYEYREIQGDHDITRLINYYLNRLNTVKPYHVCQPIVLTQNTNLYDLLKNDLSTLETKMQNQIEGCLLITLSLNGQLPFVVRLTLRKTEEAKLQLIQVVANVVTNTGTGDVKAYINSIPSKWLEKSPQANLASVKIPEQKTVDALNHCDLGVMQVALLSRLAEQYLTGNERNFPKAKNTDALIRKLRQQQIHDAWYMHDHDFYFRQQLLKKAFDRGSQLNEQMSELNLEFAC